MNLNELKDIIQKDGGKVIIIENDKPSLVIMSFQEYKARVNNGSGVARAEAKEVIPELEPERQEELTIDDLPV